MFTTLLLYGNVKLNTPIKFVWHFLSQHGNIFVFLHRRLQSSGATPPCKRQHSVCQLLYLKVDLISLTADWTSLFPLSFSLSLSQDFHFFSCSLSLSPSLHSLCSPYKSAEFCFVHIDKLNKSELRRAYSSRWCDVLLGISFHLQLNQFLNSCCVRLLPFPHTQAHLYVS